MSLIYFWKLIKSKKLVISLFVLIFFVLSVGLTLSQPLKYSSSLRLLVVQNTSATDSDPYAIARSNEYLSDVLSKVTYSTSFYARVMASGFNIDSSYFGKTNKKIFKNWNKTIEVKKINNTGIISVTAYHSKPDQAEKIARAVGYVLITQNNNYHGLGDKVSLKLLDEPITSTWPVKPNLLLNAILSLFLGLISALIYVYLWGADKLSFLNEDFSEIVDAKSQSVDWQKEVEKTETEVITPVDEYHFIPEEEAIPKLDDWSKDWR